MEAEEVLRVFLALLFGVDEDDIQIEDSRIVIRTETVALPLVQLVAYALRKLGYDFADIKGANIVFTKKKRGE